MQSFMLTCLSTAQTPRSPQPLLPATTMPTSILHDNESPRPNWTAEPLQSFLTMSELRMVGLWRAVLAEFLATFCFLFFVVMAIVHRADGEHSCILRRTDVPGSCCCCDVLLRWNAREDENGLGCRAQ